MTKVNAARLGPPPSGGILESCAPLCARGWSPGCSHHGHPANRSVVAVGASAKPVAIGEIPFDGRRPSVLWMALTAVFHQPT